MLVCWLTQSRERHYTVSVTGIMFSCFTPFKSHHLFSCQRTENSTHLCHHPCNSVLEAHLFHLLADSLQAGMESRWCRFYHNTELWDLPDKTVYFTVISNSLNTSRCAPFNQLYVTFYKASQCCYN